MDNKKIKVLHLPTTVGGNPQNLAKAERDVSLDSWAVTVNQNYLNYASDEVLYEGDSRFICELKRWRFYFKLFFRFDIIHYNFGSTLSPMLNPPGQGSAFCLKKVLRWSLYYYSLILRFFELNILHFMNKPIFVTYQGSDARQGDYCKQHFEISFVNEVDDKYFSDISDNEKRKNIHVLNEFAYKIYSLNPDLLHILPERAEFIPYAHVNMNEWKPTLTANKKIRIIHAPSNQGVKGTKYVLDAVSKLREAGYDFEFELIEGLPNEIARKHYEKADLLIDQLFAGWYGGLAVELMALGKPVICYIREEDLKFIPSDMRDDLPIIKATSDTLYDVLRYWILAPKDQLISYGCMSRQYVEKWHDPQKIAFRLKNDYEESLDHLYNS